MMLVLAIVEIFSVILQRIFCDSTLKKKKIRRYTDYLVWGGYFAVFNGVTYVLTYLGDGTSNIWLNILLFVCIFFVTIRILYTDSVRTLMATTIFMYMSGMCAELLVYYGKEFLKPGMTLQLEKEPDNQYDKEAIVVKMEGLGDIGYVANSTYTVIGESMSAGRIYDKIGDTAKAKVVLITDRGIICKISKKSLSNLEQ
mgnify:CR=1 FL=1